MVRVKDDSTYLRSARAMLLLQAMDLLKLDYKQRETDSGLRVGRHIYISSKPIPSHWIYMYI